MQNAAHAPVCESLEQTPTGTPKEEFIGDEGLNKKLADKVTFAACEVISNKS